MTPKALDTEITVFVVDDDVQARKSVCALVASMGLAAEGFSSAEEFLATYREGRRGCVVTDLRMLGMSGLEFQQEIIRRDWPLPVVILTAYPRTSVTVQAMRAGAVTLVEKPYRDDELWDAIAKAITEEAGLWAQQQRRRDIQARMASLTPSEREVLERLVGGMPNKAIAQELGLGLRTVESRRHEVFRKMRANSLPELVRLVMEARPGGTR